MIGYVLLHRSVYDHPVFKDHIEASAFVWMFAMAAWQPTRVRYKDRIINLERGQLAISVRDLSRKFGWTKSAGHRFLENLKKRDMIGTGSGTGVTVITICNYDKFQILNGNIGTSAGHTAGHGRDTSGTQNNEGNEVNKEISLSIAGGGIGTAEIDADWRRDDGSFRVGRKAGYSDDEIEWLAESFRDYWLGNGERKKDWQATFRSFLRSDIAHRIIDQHRKSNGNKHRQDGSSTNVGDRLKAMRQEGRHS